MTTTIDLTPAVLDLSLYAGDGEDFQITFLDDKDLPVDISDLNWTAQIRKTRASEVSVDLDIDTSRSNLGIIIIHISSDVTRGLSASNQWDLQTTSFTRPEPLTIFQGKVICSLDVTR